MIKLYLKDNKHEWIEEHEFASARLRLIKIMKSKIVHCYQIDCDESIGADSYEELRRFL